MHRWGKAVLDAQIGAQTVEIVLAGGGTLAQAEQAIRKLFSVICENVTRGC